MQLWKQMYNAWYHPLSFCAVLLQTVITESVWERNVPRKNERSSRATLGIELLESCIRPILLWLTGRA